MKTILIFSLLISALAFGQTKPADKTAQLEQRLIELESRQQALEKWYTDYYVQGQNRVVPYLGERLSIGGFFETAVVGLSGTDMQTQTGFTGTVLGLNLSAEFSDKIKFVTQLLSGVSYTLGNPHNNPNLTPSQRGYTIPSISTLVAQGYVEITQSDALVMQAGLGYMPFGISFQQRDFVLFRRRGGPQMLTSASDLVFPLWTGVHVSGSFFNENDLRWGYNLYTFSPTTNSKSLGVGARLWKDFSETLSMGTSFQQSQTASDMTHVYGFDAKYVFEQTGVIFEFAKNEYNSGAPSPVSYYVEPFMKFDEGHYVVYVFADYLESPNRTVGAVADPFERWQYGTGINWLPVPNTRFRAGYTTSKYHGSTDVINNQGRDFEQLDLSAGIAF
jgi:hypothetical protein